MDRLPLIGPRARLHRAREHLEALKAQIATLLDSQPFLIVPEFDSQTREHIMRIRVRGHVPTHLSLIVGDTIHNARSALDQAAWLVAARTLEPAELWEPKTAKKISFPLVRTSRDEFLNHNAMRFFGPDAKPIFEEMQPCLGGNLAQSLDRLDFYWNVDKHRTLHPGLARLDLTGVTFEPRFLIATGLPGDLEWTWPSLPDTFKDGTEVARVKFSTGAGPPETYMHVKGQPSAQIRFGNALAGIDVSTDDLGGLIDVVDTVLTKFEALRADY